MSINSKMFKFLTVCLIITIFSVTSNVGQFNLSSSVEEERTLTILTDFDFTITNEFESQFLSSPIALSLGISDIEFHQIISYERDQWSILTSKKFFFYQGRTLHPQRGIRNQI